MSNYSNKSNYSDNYYYINNSNKSNRVIVIQFEKKVH